MLVCLILYLLQFWPHLFDFIFVLPIAVLPTFEVKIATTKNYILSGTDEVVTDVRAV